MLIRKQLTDRARDFNIILDDVAITELSFGREYAAAVEAKQVAQQEAQRAAFVVDKAKQEKLEASMEKRRLETEISGFERKIASLERQIQEDAPQKD